MATQVPMERAGEESVIIVSRRQPVKSPEITAISHKGRRRREEPRLTDATRRRCQRPRRRTCSHGLPLIKEACCGIVLSICTRSIHSPCSSVPGKKWFSALGPKGHSSFFIYSSLPHFLFLSLDLFALFFSLFSFFLRTYLMSARLWDF